jgi:hypothetical protein
MTAAQESFYWRLWGMARKADRTLGRHALHEQLGLPASHKDFGNAAFDRWKSHCLALARPADYEAQVEMVRMPAERMRWMARAICGALGEGPEYAERTLRKMNREGGVRAPQPKQRHASDSPWPAEERAPGAGRYDLGLEEATEDDLRKLLAALVKACRRFWKTKDDLLSMIAATGRELEEEAARAAAAKALHVEPAALPRLEKLPYERLLVVLCALRELAGAASAAVEQEGNPF